MRLCTLLLYVAAAAATAQPATVDGELAFALLGIESADGLTADEVPADLQTFLPDGATVVGSVVQPQRVNNVETTVYTAIGWVADAPDVAAQAYEGRSYPGLELRNGSGQVASEPGFVSQQGRPMSFSYYPSSRDGRTVHVEFRTRPWGGTFVVVRQRGLFAFERAAGELPDPQLWEVSRLVASLPPLMPPPGDTQSRSGSGGSSDNYTSRATLQSDLSIGDVADHVGRQLAEGGWTSGARSTADGMVASVWTRIYEGEAIAAMLYVRRDRPGHAELAIHVMGPER